MNTHKMNLIFMIFALGLMGALSIGAQSPFAPVIAKVESARALFADPGGCEDKTREAIESLLDGILLATPKSHLPREIEVKITQARDYLKKNPLDPGGMTGPIAESYALAHGGKAFEMPVKVKTMPEILDFLDGRLSDSRRYFETGKVDDGVKAILEALAAITTPVTAS